MLGSLSSFHLGKISKHSGGFLSFDFAPWKFNMDPENRPETQKERIVFFRKMVSKIGLLNNQFEDGKKSCWMASGGIGL